MHSDEAEAKARRAYRCALERIVADVWLSADVPLRFNDYSRWAYRVRPVSNPAVGSIDVDQTIPMHSARIEDNLRRLGSASFFVKFCGRQRGNSVIEAISIGTPVFLRPEVCCGNIALPQESYFRT